MKTIYDTKIGDYLINREKYIHKILDKRGLDLFDLSEGLDVDMGHFTPNNMMFDKYEFTQTAKELIHSGYKACDMACTLPFKITKRIGTTITISIN